jgi:hypothetical protein
LDPVGWGGFRAPVQAKTVPSNVDYFFLRYQQTNPFPFENMTNWLTLGSFDVLDVLSAEGHLPFVHAARQNQHAQNLRREANGDLKTSEIPGTNIPTGIPQLLMHGELPHDEYIQAQITRVLRRDVLNFNPQVLDHSWVTGGGSLRGAIINFSEPMNPSSFTAADVSNSLGRVTGVAAVAGTQNRSFRVSFDPVPLWQLMGGIGGKQVKLSVSPQINDVVGHSLDQNRNAVSGESTDRYHLQYGVAPPKAIDAETLAGAFVHESEVLLQRAIDAVVLTRLRDPDFNRLSAELAIVPVITSTNRTDALATDLRTELALESVTASDLERSAVDQVLDSDAFLEDLTLASSLGRVL